MARRLRVGINGFGRIGRAIYRLNEAQPQFDIVAVNDINPDPDNVIYQLKYDSTYGRIGIDFTRDGATISGGRVPFVLHRESSITDVAWSAHDIDVVIDASGVHDNVVAAPECIGGSVRKVIVTHSPKEVDATIVLGANHESYRPDEHHVISSSICDANAIAPAIRVIRSLSEVDHGYVTTLHPWLSYQNLLDGPAPSQSYPGEIYHHYALGRASLPNLIPKPTTAVGATERVLPEVTGKLLGFSYRTPTAIVTSAALTLTLSEPVEAAAINQAFRDAAAAQSWQIFEYSEEPLVSMDYCGSRSSSIVDGRWTEVIGGTHVRLVLWYDNEHGYSSRVCDLVPFVLGATT